MERESEPGWTETTSVSPSAASLPLICLSAALPHLPITFLLPAWLAVHFVSSRGTAAQVHCHNPLQQHLSTTLSGSNPGSMRADLAPSRSSQQACHQTGLQVADWASLRLCPTLVFHNCHATVITCILCSAEFHVNLFRIFSSVCHAVFPMMGLSFSLNFSHL